jgi:hypothetical protein
MDFRVHAVYIIAKDGRCAYSRPFSDLAPPEDLVSAMLIAMQGFIFEVTNEYFNELTAGPFMFTLEKAGPFTVTIVSTRSDEVINSAKYLGLRFIKRFRNLIEHWNGDTEAFESFDEDVNEIFEIQTVIRKDPLKPLNAPTLILLPNHLQLVANYLLQNKEGTINQIADGIRESAGNTEKKAQELVSLGHIGQYQRGMDVVYFVK